MLDNGRTASLAHTVSGDFNIVKGLSRSFTMHFPETAKLAKKGTFFIVFVEYNFLEGVFYCGQMLIVIHGKLV